MAEVIKVPKGGSVSVSEERVGNSTHTTYVIKGPDGKVEKELVHVERQPDWMNTDDRQTDDGW